MRLTDWIPAPVRRHPWAWGTAAALLSVLGAVVLVSLWRHFGAPPPGKLAADVREAALDWLQSIPVALYLFAFAVLTAFGFPLSLFYLTAATVVGGPVLGLVAAWSCVTFNIAMSYGLAVGVGHPLIERFIARRGFKIPKVTAANQRRVTVLVRLSPAPLCVQNYILALGGVEFGLYMRWSVPIQGAIGTGVVLFGDSIFSGRAGNAMLGIFLIVLVAAGISWWRRRQPKSAHELGA